MNPCRSGTTAASGRAGSCGRTDPLPSPYRALLQLPLTVLQRVLNEKGAAGEALRGALAAHVASPQNTVAVLPQMLRYLQEPLRLDASAMVPA